MQGASRDYSPDLAALLKKQGKTVLTLMLTFDHSRDSDKPGLLQYLEGKAAAPAIHHRDFGNVVEAGGSTPFAIELLNTAAFETFLNG